MAFISLAARFMYVFYMGDSDLEGDFVGFRWLSIFLYNFGVEVSMVGMGVLMWVSTKFHSRKSFSRKIFRIIAAAWIAVGFFFMGWIFTDAAHFTRTYEIIFSILMSIFATGITIVLTLFISSELTSIKDLKDAFFDYIIEFRLHYKRLLANTLHRNEQYKATLEILEEDLHSDAFEEMVKKDTRSTEEVMRQKAKEIDEWDI